MMTLEGLCRIASNSGGMILDGSKFTPTTLSQIAANAANRGSHIIVRNLAGFTLDGLCQIAANGKGAVIFDLSNE